jgi:hypothetical protein
MPKIFESVSAKAVFVLTCAFCPPMMIVKDADNAYYAIGDVLGKTIGCLSYCIISYSLGRGRG